ncbi:MAG: deaminase [Gemmatimonadetes bacterium]|nr:MAG: deaminase [Gemmatimonadota bacterium]
MRRLMVLEMVTLDGVMQAPGGREEDPRGGFTHGGWSAPYNDSVKMQVMGEGMSRGADMLFGRWTYEKMYNVWHGRTDNPFTAVFERSQKYVASRTLRGPLPWVNSTPLEGDAADAVARLKQEPGLDLLVMGSGVLAESLMRRGLVDEFQLLIHPLVLGSGRRLFSDGVPYSALKLVKSVPTTTGVIIATYEPVDGAARKEA